MNHANSDRPDKVALVEGDSTFTYEHIENIGQFASGLSQAAVISRKRELPFSSRLASIT